MFGLSDPCQGLPGLHFWRQQACDHQQEEEEEEKEEQQQQQQQQQGRLQDRREHPGVLLCQGQRWATSSG